MSHFTRVVELREPRIPKIQFLEWRDNFKHLSNILNQRGFDCNVISLKSIRSVLPIPTPGYVNSIESDILITHNPYHGLLGAAIAKKLGKTEIIGLRLKGNYWEESADSKVGYRQRTGFALKMMQNKAGLKEVDFIVTCSDYLKDISEKQIPEKKAYTMYEGVDTERFRPLPKNSEYASELLCVMNFKVRGKLLYFKRFFEYYKDMQLPYSITFLGDGPYRGRVEKQAKETGLADQVYFKGHVNDIEKYYANSDLLVHPSSLDTLGMAVQEAASSGVPAITTKIGGLPEVVSEGVSGYTGNDMEIFVERIAQLMQDDEQRAWMGVNARNQMIEKFSLTTCAEQFIHILDREHLLN